jgi:LCP family protein required for cell wall assembly
MQTGSLATEPPDADPHSSSTWAADRAGGTTYGGTTYGGTTSGGDDSTPSGGRKGSTRRDPRWARLLIIFGAVLMMLSGVTVVGERLLIQRYEKSVPQQNLLGAAAPKAVPGKNPLDGPLNILLVGLDARPNETEAMSRADTIILLHIPATHDRAYLVSVPRDLMVQVQPFKKSGYAGGRAKMTESFFFGAQRNAGVAGGMELLALTIRDKLGITINDAAIINFQSFTAVLEALGGVDMCFDEQVQSKHLRMVNGKPVNVENMDNPPGTVIVYPKGQCRHLAAWEALDYSRQRYGLENGDYDRQRHQQQLIKAMVKAATGAGVITNPGKLDRVIRAAGSAFIIDTNGVPLADFAFALKGVGVGSMVMVRTNAGKITSQDVNGISFETLTPDSQAMFQALKNDQLDTFLSAHADFIGA